MWLRVRILNSLVFSFSTTVRAIRDSLREAVHACSASFRIIGSISVSQNILFKRVLGGYRLCWPVRDYLVVVDSPRQLVETHAIAAEAALECRQIHSPQVGDGLYLKVLQFFFCDFAYFPFTGWMWWMFTTWVASG